MFRTSLTQQLTPLEAQEDENSVGDLFQADVNDSRWTIDPPPNAPKKQAGAKVIESKAKFWKAIRLAKSPYLNGEAAVEVAVQAQKNFPVQDELPILNIGGNKFNVSRYPSNGKTDVLIFSINSFEFERLPRTAEAQVQYGRTNPRKIWKMPNFDKARLSD